MTSKLFMFYVGGDFANSNIELHDMRFTIGKDAEDCYDDLRSQWWGIPSSLHIDGWAEISQVDGYDVHLSPEPIEGEQKLFFLNLGGYTDEIFEELHRNILVVANNRQDAVKQSVRAQTDWKSPHKDAVIELEKAISISECIQGSGLNIHLRKADEHKDSSFVNKYIPIGKK